MISKYWNEVEVIRRLDALDLREMQNSNSLLKDYIKEVRLFSYANFAGKTVGIFSAISNYFLGKTEYDKVDYQFLYRICVGNYFILDNIFHDDIIGKIIEAFNNSKYYLEKETSPFIELILGHYRINRDRENFTKYCELYSQNDENIVIVILEKVNFYIYIDYDYKSAFDEISKISIQNLSKNYILIVRYLYFLNILGFDLKACFESQKEYIHKLFDEMNVDASFNLSCLSFLLYCNEYYPICGIDAKECFDKIQKGFNELGFKSVSDYLKKIIHSDTIRSYRRNEDLRHLKPGFSLSYMPNDNLSVFNFFEYTGCLPKHILYNYDAVMDYIRKNSKDESLLVNMLFNSLTFTDIYNINRFSNGIFDKVLRYISKETLSKIYRFFYDCIKLNCDDGKDKVDIVSYFELLLEIAFRLTNKKEDKKLCDFVELQLRNENGIMKKILDSHMGLNSEYFTKACKWYLQNISSQNQYEKLLLFVFNNSICDNISYDVFVLLYKVGNEICPERMKELINQNKDIFLEKHTSNNLFVFVKCLDDETKKKITKRFGDSLDSSEARYYEIPETKSEIEGFISFVESKTYRDYSNGLEINYIIKKLCNNETLFDNNSANRLFEVIVDKIKEVLSIEDKSTSFNLSEKSNDRTRNGRRVFRKQVLEVF